MANDGESMTSKVVAGVLVSVISGLILYRCTKEKPSPDTPNNSNTVVQTNLPRKTPTEIKFLFKGDASNKVKVSNQEATEVRDGDDVVYEYGYWLQPISNQDFICTIATSVILISEDEEQGTNCYSKQEPLKFSPATDVPTIKRVIGKARCVKPDSSSTRTLVAVLTCGT